MNKWLKRLFVTELKEFQSIYQEGKILIIGEDLIGSLINSYCFSLRGDLKGIKSNFKNNGQELRIK